jgi:RNA polymerase sigma-70 factor (ECF subfamily)
LQTASGAKPNARAEKAMDRERTTALLREARAGSRPALETIFERYAPRLLAVIRLRMGPSLRARLESGDVLNAALLKAFQRLDQFERAGGASLMAWLARIAENEIRDQADYHGRRRRDAARVVETEGGPDGLAAALRSQSSRVILDEELRRLGRALERLEPDHREVIVLRRLQELDLAQVATRMGRSADACRMLLARAMTELTLRMQDEP